MASTYSTSLKLQLMATGENTGTWGNVTNVNLGTALEEAIVGSVNVTFSSADVTLTLTDTNAAQTARNMRLVLTGTSGGARQLVVPAVEKIYIVKNELADTCTVKVSGQTGVAVPSGKTMWLCNDGTDVKDVVTHLSSLTLGTALAPAQGGTGLTTVGTSGNVLTSNGSAWVSSAAFTAGMILLWSGSIATIPSGWALCDGTNGTPNLRDRFIVGAGSTYAVAATGGSADAIVVSHNHTATSSVTDPGHTHTTAIQLVQDTGNGNSPRMTSGGSTATASAVTGISVSTTVATTGSSGTNANLPPYYALAYIMKL